MRTPYSAENPRKQGDPTWTAALRDPRGRRIGRAERLFLNESDEPEYILVLLDIFGFKTALIPVQGVLTDEERRALVLQ